MYIGYLVMITYQVGSDGAIQRASYRVEGEDRDHGLVRAGIELGGQMCDSGWPIGTVVRVLDVNTELDWEGADLTPPPVISAPPGR